MPYLAFASNFTWVMVMGLLGPSLPEMIDDLGLGYAEAGRLFTVLALGSLFGTLLSGAASDRVERRALFAAVAGCLALGLFGLALASTYALVLVAVLFFSLTGSPAGTVGQGIMLEMFPERRERYLALLTTFAAVGSLVAPLLVALNEGSAFGSRLDRSLGVRLGLRLGWRLPFLQAGVVALLLCAAILAVPLPRPRAGPANDLPERRSLRSLGRLLAHPRVASAALLIVLSVGPDLGFSFWLAEHFRSELGVSIALSSAVVSVYLGGVIAGRLATAHLVRRLPPGLLLCIGPLASLAGLAALLFGRWMPVKLAAIVLYGLGIGPVFPLLMARGTAAFPRSPGAVSGLLFASVSLGGMIFPQLLGSVAAREGIRRSYALLFVLLVVILAAALVWLRRDRARGGRRPRA